MARWSFFCCLSFYLLSVSSTVIKNKEGLWPKRRVYYDFSDNVDDAQRFRLKHLFNKFHAKTCVRFVRRVQNVVDYVIFRSGTRKVILPHLGKRGGKQGLTFEAKDFEKPGFVLRDIMRALGFYYEIQRPDRDRFVRLFPTEIMSNYSSLFDVPDASEIDLQGEDYDFNSATHFSASDYSTGSNPIFTLVDTSDTLEQHDGLSEIDVRRINKAYNCDFITSVNKLCPEKWFSGEDGKCYYFSFADPLSKPSSGSEAKRVCTSMLGIPLIIPEMNIPSRGLVLETMRQARVSDIWVTGSLSTREAKAEQALHRTVFDVIGNVNFLDNNALTNGSLRSFACQQTAANECLYVRNDTLTTYPECSRLKVRGNQLTPAARRR